MFRGGKAGWKNEKRSVGMGVGVAGIRAMPTKFSDSIKPFFDDSSHGY